MVKYKIDFYTKSEITSCKSCRLKKDVADYYKSANWICNVNSRHISKFVNQEKLPNWCPLVKIEEN